MAASHCWCPSEKLEGWQNPEFIVETCYSTGCPGAGWLQKWTSQNVKERSFFVSMSCNCCNCFLMLSMEFQYRFPYNCQQWSAEKYPMLNILCVTQPKRKNVQTEDAKWPSWQLRASLMTSLLRLPCTLLLGPECCLLTVGWQFPLLLAVLSQNFKAMWGGLKTASG